MKKTFILMLVLLFLLCACETDVAETTSVTTEIVTYQTEVVTTEETVLPENELGVIFNEVSNPANFDINVLTLPLKGEKSRVSEFDYDERYVIYVTGEILKNGVDGYADCAYEVYVLDKKLGEYVFAEELNTDSFLRRISYTDDGCIIHNITVENDVAVVSNAYEITENDGVFSVSPTTAEAYPSVRKKVISPNGRYTALENELDGWNNGGIEVKYPDGSEKRILTNITLGNSPECKAKTIGEHIGYGIVGFVDDTHLAYSITGYEWLIGYGIYDLESGKATEYRNERDRAFAAYSGYVYAVENKYHEYEPYPDAVSLYKMSLDGTKTTISEYPYSGLKYPDIWCTADSEPIDSLGRTTVQKVRLFSLEPEETLAEFEYISVSGKSAYFHVYEDTVTVVLPQIVQ